MTGAFTAFIGVLLLLTVIQFPLLGLLYSGAPSWRLTLVQIVAWVLGVGLFEEATKMLPVL